MSASDFAKQLDWEASPTTLSLWFALDFSYFGAEMGVSTWELYAPQPCIHHAEDPPPYFLHALFQTRATTASATVIPRLHHYRSETAKPSKGARVEGCGDCSIKLEVLKNPPQKTKEKNQNPRHHELQRFPDHKQLTASSTSSRGSGTRVSASAWSSVT